MEENEFKNYYDEVFNGLSHTLRTSAKGIAVESETTTDEDVRALNNLNCVIEMCLIVEEVFMNGNKNIHPAYALEKLKRAKYSLDIVLNHFEEKENNDEE